jgi:apolipoprotein N-acyltransferase
MMLLQLPILPLSIMPMLLLPLPMLLLPLPMLLLRLPMLLLRLPMLLLRLPMMPLSWMRRRRKSKQRRTKVFFGAASIVRTLMPTAMRWHAIQIGIHSMTNVDDRTSDFASVANAIWIPLRRRRN